MATEAKKRERGILRVMKVTVDLHPSKGPTEVLELADGATAEDAIRCIGQLPDAWIAIRDGRPIPLDSPLHDGEMVKLVAVASGG